MKRIGGALAIAATIGAVALPHGTAFADLYVGPTPIVTVDQCVVVSSPKVTITTSGFPEGVDLKLVIVSSSGTSTTSTIPANTAAPVPTPAAGSYQLTVTDAAGDHASTGFDVGTCTTSSTAVVSPPVVEPAVAAPSPTATSVPAATVRIGTSTNDLPTTGLNAELLVRFGAIAVLSGIGMAFVSRRRRRNLSTTAH